MTRQRGRPDLDTLIEAHRAEQGQLNQTMAVAGAEGVVADARIAELAAQQKTALRRVSAAKGQLTRARKDGSAEKIAAARARLTAAEADFDRISDACITEMQQITGARLDNLGTLLHQMDRTWTAGSAVTDALTLADERGTR